jgi:hypothetical protein
METKEIRIVLDEKSFTNLCKSGFFSHNSPEFGNTDIHIYKHDIKNLISDKIVTKEIGNETFNLALAKMEYELVKEIVRRSPIFSEMYYEL